MYITDQRETGTGIWGCMEDRWGRGEWMADRQGRGGQTGWRIDRQMYKIHTRQTGTCGSFMIGLPKQTTDRPSGRTTYILSLGETWEMDRKGK